LSNFDGMCPVCSIALQLVERHTHDELDQLEELADNRWQSTQIHTR